VAEPDCIGCGKPCCGGKRQRVGKEWKKRWERLRERPGNGIATLEGGGLVSAPKSDEAPQNKRQRVGSAYEPPSPFQP